MIDCWWMITPTTITAASASTKIAMLRSAFSAICAVSFSVRLCAPVVPETWNMSCWMSVRKSSVSWSFAAAPRLGRTRVRMVWMLLSSRAKSCGSRKWSMYCRLRSATMLNCSSPTSCASCGCRSPVAIDSRSSPTMLASRSRICEPRHCTS